MNNDGDDLHDRNTFTYSYFEVEVFQDSDILPAWVLERYFLEFDRSSTRGFDFNACFWRNGRFAIEKVKDSDTSTDTSHNGGLVRRLSDKWVVLA